MDILQEGIDQVDNVSNIFVEYGVFIGILSIFIVIFVCVLLGTYRSYQKQITQLMSDNKKHYDDNTKLMQELLTVALSNNNKLASKPEPESSKKSLVKTYIDVNSVFRTACKGTLEALEADRVAIYVFHNGNKSIHGFPFFKMSCVGEWVLYSNGVNNQGKSHSDLPLHLFSSIIENIYDDGEYYTDPLDPVTNESLKTFIDSYQINFIYIRAILDNYQNLAGFSIAEFKQQQSDKMIYNTIRPQMQELNNNVRDIIIQSDIQKKLTNVTCPE